MAARRATASEGWQARQGAKRERHVPAPQKRETRRNVSTAYCPGTALQAATAKQLSGGDAGMVMVVRRLYGSA